MEEQDNNRPSIPTWVWILAVFALILGVQLFLSGRFNGPEQVDLKEVMNSIQAGQVKEISVIGDRLQVTMKDDSVVSAYKYTRDSLAETFQYYGITAEQLQPVNLIVRDQSARNNFITILVSVGPAHLDIHPWLPANAGWRRQQHLWFWPLQGQKH